MIKKVCNSLWNLRIESKKIHRVLEFNQLQCLKPYTEFNTQETIAAENHDDDRKALYRWWITLYMEKQRKTLFAIRKSKLVLKLNKPVYIGMCILELSKVFMYEFHYDYIKMKYDNK